MQLESFRVYNFRSINDSGSINASRITALLGRNESGKSNLLLALRSLNPAEGFAALSPIKDFPRHRRLQECTDLTHVLRTVWKLDGSEKTELTAILPRASTVTHVEIGRYYGKQRWVNFPDLATQSFDETDVKSKLRKVVAAGSAAADKLGEPARTELSSAAERFLSTTALNADRTVWAKNTSSALALFRKALAKADADLSDKQEQLVVELEELTQAIAGDEEAQQRAREWAAKQIPQFIYLDEYPELNGHQNIAEYLQRKANGALHESDKNFEKLCKVADLDPEQLQQLLGQKKQETRNQLANRASAVVTSEIKRLWKDRQLKVRFNLDAEHLDTFVSDPNGTFDVEVNLNERSRGFKWFFSFYITFSADTKGGIASTAILLLDEPGLYLHAKSQTDLLAHFEKDFANQIIFTTHSPFMVPTHNLDSIRTVNIAEDAGTTVTNDPTGDARTLFPLQAALGYTIAQSLFVGQHNLVVEGVTDFWILTAISNHLSEIADAGLNSDLTVTPVGGAQKVSYMVALLTSEQLNVLVLFDDERIARTTKDELVKTRLIKERDIIFVSEAFGAGRPSEADVEDLLDPAVYESLVRESYKKELAGKTLNLNVEIPRIAKRFEAAFEELELKFVKTRPARLLLTKMGSTPELIVTADASQKFGQLFTSINQRFEARIRRGPSSFQ